MKNISCVCKHGFRITFVYSSVPSMPNKGIEETLQILWRQTEAEEPDQGSALFLWFRGVLGAAVPSTTSINVTDHKGTAHWEWIDETKQNGGINFTRVCTNMKVYCPQHSSPSQFTCYIQLNVKWNCSTISAVLYILSVCTNPEAMPSVSDTTETVRPWMQSFSSSCKIETY